MNFKIGQRVRIIKKSVGVSIMKCHNYKMQQENGTPIYIVDIEGTWSGFNEKGYLYILSSYKEGNKGSYYIKGDFILVVPSIIEVDE
jgi:hypothetical protein